MADTLNGKSLGLALGVLWGAAVFLLGLGSMLFDYGTALVTVLSSIYIGYAATVVGSIIGAVWGFVDAFIGGWLIAWLYNKF